VPAVLIHHLAFWIEHNRANKRHFIEGHWWTYNSITAYQALFSYLTEKQIRGALRKLIDKGVLLTGRHHDNKYDRTTWYAFADEDRFLDSRPDAIDLPSGENADGSTGKSICQRREIDLPPEETRSADEGKSLITTDVNAGVNQMVGAPRASDLSRREVAASLRASKAAPRLLSSN